MDSPLFHEASSQCSSPEALEERNEKMGKTHHYLFTCEATLIVHRTLPPRPSRYLILDKHSQITQERWIEEHFSCLITVRTPSTVGPTQEGGRSGERGIGREGCGRGSTNGAG